ncbi:flagellar filament capping protein FliD [Sporosarcina luteola]|uniref:flagellar filament capping protein FliD n=1 Tax=Sporosarcina luteola TaxID=582850 RepID=UPI0020410E4A|nr:flagellar filament capping protein FliD [Sporosarcina luteola]MCM3743857.1 flagellar filament capping protein FliD [Sporosarcina luteola]
MRVSGLASGMDTEQIIKEMMTANRIPLDKITQKKQYLEWQLDDYRSVNRQLFDFSQNTFNNMILSKNFTAKNVSVSSPDAVAVKNLSSTSDFSGTIEIHQLAKNATMQGGEITIGGKKLTSADVNTTKLSSLENIQSTGKVKLSVTAPGSTEATELEFSVDDSIGVVIAQINEKTGVNAFYDEFTGKIALSAKNSGSGTLKIEGDLAAALKINQEVSNGQNAIFTFNGLQTERSSNTFQINGFEMNLKQVTSPLEQDANGNIKVSGQYIVVPNGKTVSFNSSPDTSKIFDSIVKYVDDYNKLIEDLNKQIREPKYRSFQPLSAEQKKDMKEKEIELWEEKAKSGTLRNDSDISALLTKMRSTLLVSVNGMSLKDIGITTSSAYSENGKLVINEDKLKEAIAKDPNKVHQLFAYDASKDTDKTKNGLARLLRSAVDDTQKVIKDRAGIAGSVNHTFSLGKSLESMNKQIERFEDRLKTTENRLWKQFTAMEKAIHRANSQSMSLMNAFGGGM